MSSQVPGSVAEAEIEADAAEADVDAQNHADEPDMVKEQELMDHLARTHDERRSKDGSADVETLEKHLTKAVRFSRAESTTQPPKADPLFGGFEWSTSDNVSTPPDSPLDDDELLESPMQRMRCDARNSYPCIKPCTLRLHGLYPRMYNNPCMMRVQSYIYLDST